MRILIAHDTYHPHINGASYFTQRLAVNLHRRGHEVLVIAPSTTWRHETREHAGVPVVGIRSFPYNSLNFKFRVSPPVIIKRIIKKTIAEFKPDVLHIQGHFTIGKAAFKLARQAGIPVVGTNHFMPDNLVHYLPLPIAGQKLVARFLWRQFRNVFEKVDVITTPTKSAAALLDNIGLSQQVLAISNGIDLSVFHPGNDGEYLRERYHIPKKPILLFVGRLDKEKNVDLILSAVEMARQQIDMHFVIAGLGAEINHLKKLANTLKLDSSVTFAGFVPDEDLPNLYTLANCFIMICEAELQGLAVMEAMATALPVIAADALALPELVLEGENGYLVRPHDIELITAHIVRILSDPGLQRRMGQKSLEIATLHDIEKVMDTYEEIYRSAIKKKTP